MGLDKSNNPPIWMVYVDGCVINYAEWLFNPIEGKFSSSYIKQFGKGQ